MLLAKSFGSRFCRNLYAFPEGCLSRYVCWSNSAADEALNSFDVYVSNYMFVAFYPCSCEFYFCFVCSLLDLFSIKWCWSLRDKGLWYTDSTNLSGGQVVSGCFSCEGNGCLMPAKRCQRSSCSSFWRGFSCFACCFLFFCLRRHFLP